MHKIRTLLIGVLGIALSGCTLLCAPYCGGATATRHGSTSLVEFLYPNGAPPPSENSVPELSEIVIIPDYYLAAQRGFAGLEAVQRLYSVDVMALVSYDQVMHAEQNNWSLGYLTIVGMYVLKGNRYDVSTLVDLAVVDPATRSLILRAGGIDTRHGNTTMIGERRESREAGGAAFSAASGQMIQHFDAALTDFEAQVRAGHANVRVVRKDGSGGGAFTWPWLLALLAVAVARVRGGCHEALRTCRTQRKGAK